MKTLACKDIGMQCDWVGRAENEQELMKQAAQHVKDVHKIDVTPEMEQQARKVTRDE